MEGGAGILMANKGWAKIFNLSTNRETTRYHYFEDGSSLCGKYMAFRIFPVKAVRESFCCRECVRREAM
jgi:hypothetical protein